MGYTTKQRRAIIDRTMGKIVRAKGNNYYELLAVLELHLSDELTLEVETIREGRESKGISFADVCHLLVRFEFPVNRMKSLMVILQNNNLIPSDMYKKTKYLGVKKSLIQLGYKKCTNPGCWRWALPDSQCVCKK